MTEKKPQISNTYDEMYSSSSPDGAYTLPYRNSCYFPLYRQVRNLLLKNNIRSVLEVGCGSGGLAHYLFETTKIDYRGFDFSAVAVKKAKERTGKGNVFYVGDATQYWNYQHAYQAIVCTEVLEHVEKDVAIIKNWKKGTFCICSVPNFDSPYHVRFFKNKNQVIDRYGEIMEITSIFTKKKPVLEDISLKNRLRQLRWNRYRPKRLLEILELGNFESVGGWFIFCGYIR